MTDSNQRGGQRSCWTARFFSQHGDAAEIINHCLSFTNNLTEIADRGFIESLIKIKSNSPSIDDDISAVFNDDEAESADKALEIIYELPGVRNCRVCKYAFGVIFGIER